LLSSYTRGTPKSPEDLLRNALPESTGGRADGVAEKGSEGGFSELLEAPSAGVVEGIDWGVSNVGL
jgi:hypothetical protein